MQITTSDGYSVFSTQVYASPHALQELVSALDDFKGQVHGGLYDIRFGEFGPEYGGGAFHARLHFHTPGRLYLTIKAETEWREFSKSEVANQVTLHLRSEPGMLDNFIGELKRLSTATTNEAFFQCLGL